MGDLPTPESPALTAENWLKSRGSESPPCSLPAMWHGPSFHPQCPHSPELPQPGFMGCSSKMKGQMQGAAGFSWGLLPGLLPRPSERPLPHTVLQGLTFQAS